MSTPLKLRGMIFGCALLGVLALVPTALADHWQKSSDGYWYYWSDSDRRWYWQDGRDWYVQENGDWVKWTPRAAGYSSYYPAPGGSVSFPYGNVTWGPAGQVNFPYGSVSWGPGGGYVVFPYGSVSWPGRGWRR
jgi:hypothetical protein